MSDPRNQNLATRMVQVGLASVPIEIGHRIALLGCLFLLGTTVGCSETVPTVDDGPFRTAIAQYLQDNNMALAIKEIKAGPTVNGNRASLSASLTHEQLGGPSVTWEFQFAGQPDGTWRVISHQD